MPKETWEEYKDLKCFSGQFFKQLIYPEIKYRRNSYGLIASSNDDY